MRVMGFPIGKFGSSSGSDDGLVGPWRNEYGDVQGVSRKKRGSGFCGC